MKNLQTDPWDPKAAKTGNAAATGAYIKSCSLHEKSPMDAKAAKAGNAAATRAYVKSCSLYGEMDMSRIADASE